MQESNRDNLYHKSLRVSSAVVALVLLFDSGVLHPLTNQLSGNTQQYVASVIGVGAAVEPTELNTLTAELTRQRQDLSEREARVSEREIVVGLNNEPIRATQGDDLSTYILSTLLFIILVLIVLNYALDFMRERHLRELATQK